MMGKRGADWRAVIGIALMVGVLILAGRMLTHAPCEDGFWRGARIVLNVTACR